VARALFHRPPLLLCDELTGNLDEDNAALLVEVLRRCRDQDGATVLVATHDPLVCAAADRVVRLAGGRLAEEGGAQ
jgi:putative ABC transport system ATP-binding protein